MKINYLFLKIWINHDLFVILPEFQPKENIFVG